MSLPEYNVRIISQSSDSTSRKHLVRFICTGLWLDTTPIPQEARLAGMTITRLAYPTAFVNVIECDADCAGEITSADIVYFEFLSDWQLNGGYRSVPSDQNNEKQEWMKSVNTIGATIWFSSDWNRGCSGLSPEPPKLSWENYVQVKFGLTAKPSVAFMFETTQKLLDSIRGKVSNRASTDIPRPVPEHTVRIISQSVDRDPRKRLVRFICTGSWLDSDTIPAAAWTAPLTTTKIAYTNAYVNIVECDANVAGGISSADIVYVDLATTPFQSPSYPGMELTPTYHIQKWMQNIVNTTGAPIWGNGVALDCNIRRNYNARPCNQSEYFGNRFGLSGVPKLVSAFIIPDAKSQPEQHPSDYVRGGVGAGVLQPADVPWPVPEMTINLPSFVKVEEIRHDPATNAITIRFG